MAKATNLRVSASEERAVAAERTRQRYLDQVAAVCAQEVKRAKRVAEEIKERRQAQGRKLRDETDTRLAEAERRRAQYRQQLRRGRTVGLPPTGASLHQPQLETIADVDVPDATTVAVATAVAAADAAATAAAAATAIQRAWRTARRRRTIQDFVRLNLSIDTVRASSFEDVGALLGRESVLRSTSRVLRICQLQDADGHHPLGERTAVRTFLSAYLMLAHSTQVFSQDGEQEQVRRSSHAPDFS